MKHLRLMWAALRSLSLSTNMAIAMNRWVMQQHDAERFDDEVVCMFYGHKTPPPWPCDQFIKADRAIDDLINERPAR